MAQEKKSPIARRIMTDPLYERTRQTIAEFRRASKASKLLLDALRSAGVNARDSRLFSRLNGEMFKVVKSDKVNRRGDRTVANGDLQLLRGFDFNLNGKLSSLLYVRPTGTIDRATGTMKADISGFVPKDMVKAPFSAMHYVIACAAAEIDFEAGTFTTTTTPTEELPYDDVETAPISLTTTVTAASTKWLVLAVGIKFTDEVNEHTGQFKSGQFNALSVIAVENPPV